MKNYINILRCQERPVRFAVARGLALSGLSRFLTIKQKGYLLRFHAANLAEQLWINPHARDAALEFFRAYLKPRDYVIDVGANIGDTVLAVANQIGPGGHAWTIEAHPRTFEFLRENLSLNGVVNVTAINSAVGAGSGKVSFSNDRRDDMNRVGAGTLEVPVQPLDDLVAYRGQVALLKIDVEGYEKPVIEGAQLLLAYVQCVHFEISKTHFSWFGYHVRDLLQMVESAGFTLYRIPENGRIERVDATYETSSVENLIGIKDIEDFRQRTGWILCD